MSQSIRTRPNHGSEARGLRGELEVPCLQSLENAWEVSCAPHRDKGTVSYSETCMMLGATSRPFHCPRHPISTVLGFHPLVEIYSSIYMSCVICKKWILHKKQVFIWLFFNVLKFVCMWVCHSVGLEVREDSLLHSVWILGFKFRLLG